MDNLPFLRSLNNKCIDLIAIDPPFAANETFTSKPKPPITPAELAEELALAQSHGVEHNEGIGHTRVQDVWSWDRDIHPAWKMQIEDDYPAVHAVIQAVEACATENEAAYIAFMAVRLIECHRVLTRTGSIYVHCDSHANSYLRMLLDAIYGHSNFRNEIIWKRTAGRSDAKQFGKVHDCILFYSKSRYYTWNTIWQSHDPEYVKKQYRHTDALGHYRLADLTASGIREGESGKPWREIDPTTAGRHWGTPSKGGMNDFIIARNLIPNWPDAYPGVHSRLDALNSAGLICWPERGKMPSMKRYLDSTKGTAVEDIFSDIGKLEASDKEKTGYATQKPLALYQRIVAASSRPGDTVLDIFAGCATTAVAAENLNREWIACDMAYRSWTMLKRRFHLNQYELEGTTDATKNALAKAAKDKGYDQPFQFMPSRVIGPADLPERTDSDPIPFHRLLQGRRSSTTQSASWSGRITKEDAKKLLINRFGPVCWGCGYEPRRPNGSLDDTLLEVDHIRARKASEGAQGNDELYNLAVLHRTCNGIKRNKLTLEELRTHNAFNGLLYVNKTSDLVDLYEATQFAQEQIAHHIATYGYQPVLINAAHK